MNTVIADFEKRVAEIEIFFKHIEALEEKEDDPSIVTAAPKEIKTVDPNLIRVLKANLFLLLYNLTESSIRQAISELAVSITSEKIAYSEASDEIKRVWIDKGLRKFNNKSAKQIVDCLANLSSNIIDIPFDDEIAGGGNIDARKIREFGAVYGFSCKAHPNAKDGAKLFNVKRLRNDLAHGLVSFAECGRNYTVSDLRETKYETIVYLRAILRNISRYLDTKRFRACVRRRLRRQDKGRDGRTPS